MKHPARFSKELMPTFVSLLEGYERLLDPMAGTGERLAEHLPRAVGVEIEPEWASMSPNIIVGDATTLPFADGSFDAAVVSPCYANRFRDHHVARDKCSRCKGSRLDPTIKPGWSSFACKKCGGSGFSPRRSYRHDLDRMPNPNSAATLAFDYKYKVLHLKAWIEVFRVLRWNGLFVLNVKNFINKGEVVDVVEWHKQACLTIGFTHIKTDTVQAPGMRYGANRLARLTAETVMVFEARR